MAQHLRSGTANFADAFVLANRLGVLQFQEMARGWESKTIEAQIETAEEEKRNRVTPTMSAAEEELGRKREGLLLARTRLLQDLGAARSERYRSMLQEALTQIDSQLEALHPRTR